MIKIKHYHEVSNCSSDVLWYGPEGNTLILYPKSVTDAQIYFEFVNPCSGSFWKRFESSLRGYND